MRGFACLNGIPWRLCIGHGWPVDMARFAFLTLCLLALAPAQAQPLLGQPDVTDVESTTVMVDNIGPVPPGSNTHIPLPGGGETLWEGGILEFPADTGVINQQIYRSIAAAISATLPECHDGIVEITFSVRVRNDGPFAGRGYSGAFRLFEGGAPEDWAARRLSEAAVRSSTPVGWVQTLTVSAQVAATDLAAGDLFIHLALETFHDPRFNAGANWTADQFQASYEYAAENCAPAIDLVKTAGGPDPLTIGSTVNYQFLVTNTGDFTLSPVTVSDPLPGLSEITCADSALAPAADMSCMATYVVTPQDVVNGVIDNTAMAQGTPSSGQADVLAEDSASVEPAQLPEITIDKTGSGPDPLVAGETVDYVFLVTNTGNLPLTGVTVTDPLPGLSAITCPGDALDPGEDMSCTAQYIVTAADVAAGVIENSVTVVGAAPDMAEVSDQDSASVPPEQIPGIALVKTGTGPDPLVAGEQVSYEFAVTNTGNVPLTNVMVTDPLAGLSPVTCPGDSLAPGENMTCTATLQVTQDDVNAGIIENTATTEGIAPDNSTVSDQDSASVPPVQLPAITIDKTAGGPDPLVAGEAVSYAFLVTNTGNVPLTNVSVTDPLPNLSAIDCPDTVLPIGASINCTASYTVTPDDVNAGVIENTATAQGTAPNQTEVSDEDSASVPPAQLPSIAIEKTAGGPDPLVVGETVNYEFLVTNTGNVPLSNVMVTDPLPNLSAIDCPGATLTTGADMTCTATYEVTQDDVNAGVIENTATVQGTAPRGLTVSDLDSARVPPDQLPAIAIDKSGSGPDPLVAGAAVSYEFLVTNTGNVPLTDVIVEDPLPGLSPIDCPGDALAIGASMTCMASYTVTEADVEAGVVENTATAHGTPPGGPEVADTDSAFVPQPFSLPPEEPQQVPALPVPGLVLLALLLSAGAAWNLRPRTG